MWRIIIIMSIAMVALAGCGGGVTTNPQVSQDGVVILTATPFPTLVFEERVQFTAGFIENPFRLAIRPDTTIPTRIIAILEALTLSDDPLTLTTPLVGLEISDIAPIQAAFMADFGIGFTAADWDASATIGDLVNFAQRRVADQLILEIYERTSLYFEVILLNSYGEGLTALCESGTGVVTISVLDGITTLAALANDCGDIALQVAKSSDMPLSFAPIAIATIEPTAEPVADVTAEADATAEADVTAESVVVAEPISQPTPAPTATPAPLDLDSLVTGSQGVFFISRTFGGQSTSVMQNRILCRLNIRDFYSWFLPDLVLDTANITPLEVIDQPSPRALVDAVANDVCAGGMLSNDQFTALETTVGVDVVQRTITFPYGIFLYPLEVELGIQLRLNEVLPDMAQDPQAGLPLRLLIGQHALLPATEANLADVSRFISTTGYNLSQLGR